jgi:hypothetical protein
MYVSTSRYVRPVAHAYALLWNPSLVCQLTTTAIVVTNYLLICAWLLKIETVKSTLAPASSPQPSLSLALLAMSIFLFDKSSRHQQIRCLSLILLTAGLALLMTSANCLTNNVPAWLMYAGLALALISCWQNALKQAQFEQVDS